MRFAARPHPVRLLTMLIAVASTAGIGYAVAPASAVVRSTLTLNASARRVSSGTPVTFTAHLSGPVGDVSGADVTFYRHPASGAWQPVASIRTDRSGDARLTRRLTATAQWQARWDGDTVGDRATSATRTVSVYRPSPAASGFAERVVREAARHKGAPYEYGAAGPDAFDCSGFTMYVFGRFGIRLPHDAAGQYDAVRHVPNSDLRLGDLVFFDGSSGIYHVGIYAGHGQMWAAPHSGDHVRLESIDEARYVVGRAR